MASKYKVKRQSKSPLARIFPESFQAFVARRIIDLTALGFMVGGAFIALAIASYNRTDPSGNTATSNEVQNWMGQSGATTADRLLQTVGLGGCVLAAAFLWWGWALLRRNSIAPFWLRVTACFFATIAAAAAFARIPSDNWAPQSTLGGSGGMKILQASADLFGGSNAFTIMAWGWAGIAALFTCFAFLIGWEQIKWTAALILNLVLAAGYYIYDTACAFMNWVRHHTDDDFESEKPARRRFNLIPPRNRDEEEDEYEEEEEEEADEEEEEYEEGEEEEYEEEEYEEEEEEGDTSAASRIRVVKNKQTSQKSSGSKQKKFQLFDGGEWELPSLELLQEIDEETASQKNR